MKTHPRTSGARAQLGLLLLAVLAGMLVGAALHWADGRSWQGAVTTTAVVTGLHHDGIHATAGGKDTGKDIVLHLEKVPRTGTELTVEVRPDGRARPASYRQTWPGSLGRGIALMIGLTLIVQVYRFFVTGKHSVTGTSVPSEA